MRHYYSCKGCVCDKQENDTACILYDIYDGVEESKTFAKQDHRVLDGCPCISCIVKMMCKRFCHEYRNYIKGLLKKPDGW